MANDGKKPQQDVVEQLCSRLSGAPHRIQIGIAMALGKTRDARAVHPLCRILALGDPRTAAAAIDALEEIGDPGAALGLMADVIRFGPACERSVAVLGRWQVREAVPYLLDLLDEFVDLADPLTDSPCPLDGPSEDGFWQKQQFYRSVFGPALLLPSVATALGRIGDDRAGAPLEAAMIRLAAVYPLGIHLAHGLGLLGDSRGARFLLSRLRGAPPHEVRALEALDNLLQDCPSAIDDESLSLAETLVCIEEKSEDPEFPLLRRGPLDTTRVRHLATRERASREFNTEHQADPEE